MENARLIESIRLEDGVFHHLDYHWARMERSCRALGIVYTEYDLEAYLSTFDPPTEGLYKCRVLYDTRIWRIHFQRYFPKPVQSIQVVYADHIDYPIKTVARKAMNELNRLRRFRDDIMVVRDGWVTDSFYGNLLFLQDGVWYTPVSHLLAGVQRASLLDEGLIQERAIHISDLRHYDKVKIINAMLDLESGPEVDMLDVHVYF
jgi:4-amino-4-deoxychorismate lyase